MEGLNTANGDLEARFYRELNSAHDIDSFGNRIEDAMAHLGFDAFSYWVIGSGGRRLAEPKRLFTTLPEELHADYDERGYHRSDITVDYVYHNSGDVLYSSLQRALKRFPFETQSRLINREIHLLYRSYGYHDFYIVPLHREGTTSFLSVAFDGAAFPAKAETDPKEDAMDRAADTLGQKAKETTREDERRDQDA